MTPHRLWQKAVEGRDWRAPIAAGAYVILAVVCSVVVTFVLGYFLFVKDINRNADDLKVQNTVLVAQSRTLVGLITTLQDQALDRQHDTNAFAGAICAQRTRALVAYRDPRTSKSSAVASKNNADELWKFLRQLSPHPPTKCKGIDPYP